MATLKVKFRSSVVEGKEGKIYYQVIHKRVVRQIKTKYSIYDYEWNENTSGIQTSVLDDGERREHLTELQGHIDRDISYLTEIICHLESYRSIYSADDIVSLFSNYENQRLLSGFMRETISFLNQTGKSRTAEIYSTVQRSFMGFLPGNDIIIENINAEIVQSYESFLFGNGLVRNTTSLYMRTLRAVYNRAVEKGITVQREPFRRVYTGIDKTVKRAIPIRAIRKIKELDLSQMPALDFSRDMFMFSFYTRGMSFIDIAFLKKRNLQGGVLSYRRHKTGQQLSIKWEKCMQQILDKHPSCNASYMLPIIRNTGCSDYERRQYRNAMRFVNDKLKIISDMAGIGVKLTLYVSRHSWASAARERNIPLSVISECMGHDSETTTQIYLASLDTSAADKANQIIINSL